MNSVSRASAGARAALASECCQRIGSIDHQGRRSPGDVYNRPAHYACESPRIARTSHRHRTCCARGPETLAGVDGLLAVVVAVNARGVGGRDRAHSDRSARAGRRTAGGNHRDGAVVPAGVHARQQARTLPADRDGDFRHQHVFHAGAHSDGRRTAAVHRETRSGGAAAGGAEPALRVCSRSGC